MHIIHSYTYTNTIYTYCRRLGRPRTCLDLSPAAQVYYRGAMYTLKKMRTRVRAQKLPTDGLRLVSSGRNIPRAPLEQGHLLVSTGHHVLVRTVPYDVLLGVSSSAQLAHAVHRRCPRLRQVLAVQILVVNEFGAGRADSD